MLNVQQIYDYVRSFLDTDSTDLSDSLLSVFLLDAFQRVTRDQREWPFYASTETLATVTGQREYVLSTELPQLKDIAVIRRDDNDERLTYLDHDEAESRFNTESTGTPLAWSRWGSTLYLWPTPSADSSVTIRGWRKPSTTWQAAGASGEPDVPEELHLLLCTWVLARCYEQQDDPELASFHRSAFEQSLKEYKASVLASDPAPPLVVNRMAGTRIGRGLVLPRLEL